MQRLLVCLMLLVQFMGCVSHEPEPDSEPDAQLPEEEEADPWEVDFFAPRPGCSSPIGLTADEGLLQKYATVVLAWGARPTDVWAVRKDGRAAARLSRWDGARWSDWTLPPSAQPPTAIAGSSSQDVWFGGPTGLLHHWDGSALSAVESPASFSILGIQVLGAQEAWALSGDLNDRRELLRWDGLTWSVVTRFPLADGSPIDFIKTFWVSGPGEVWLASPQALYRWHDGGLERVLTEPGSPAIWSSGPDDVWVARDSGLKRWNGSSLVPVAGSPRKVHQLWGSGPTDIWFAGVLETGGAHLTRWNGSGFLSSAVPLEISGGWLSMMGTGPQDVWASTALHLVHWDGGAWSVVDRGSSFHFYKYDGLDDVVASLWRVGQKDLWTFEPTFDRVGHWNGQVHAPIPEVGERRATYAHLSGVWANSPTDVWAVGDSGAAVHFDGVAWSPVSTGTTATLRAVAGTGAGDVWAVGQGGTVLHWDGQAWARVDAGTNANLEDVWVEPDGFVVAVGRKGAIVQRRNGDWSALSGASGTLTNVWGRTPEDVWISSDTNAVYHLEGAGLSVASASTGVLTSYRGLWGLGSDSLVANGYWLWHGEWRNLWTLTYGGYQDVWVSPEGTVWFATSNYRPMYTRGDLFSFSERCRSGIGVYFLTYSLGREPPGLSFRALHGAGEHDLWYVGTYGRIHHYRP